MAACQRVLDHRPGEQRARTLLERARRLTPHFGIGVGDQIEISWDGTLLETSETLLPNSWSPLPEAPKPYLANPSDATRFYRSTD